MPELPDVNLYGRRLRERVLGQALTDVKLFSPFVLRSVLVPPAELVDKKVEGVSRLGKRIVLEFENDLFLVIHLMIAGRLIWSEDSTKPGTRPSKIVLAKFSWPNGSLTLQEASPKKRAGIWIVRGRNELGEHSRSGIDVLTASAEEFNSKLRQENHSLKRVLTDPNTFDGIGNAYSDEILFVAGLAPTRLTKSLAQEESAKLYEATRQVLAEWIERLEKLVPGFPKSSEVTAFRKEFFVHGRFGKPCLKCEAPIQRIVTGENEINYCARCQNNGKLLADRSLSRLLKDDWPKTIEQLLAD